MLSLLHPREDDRLRALAETGVVDAPADPLFESAVRLAAQICGAPIAVISLIESERVTFAAKLRFEADATVRAQSFCAHAIVDDGPLVVEDATADARFAHLACVAGDPRIRFYAGVPVCADDGLPAGALCVVDTEVRTLAPSQLEALVTLAELVTSHLKQRRLSRLLAHERNLLARIADSASDHAMITLDASGRVTSWNQGAERIFHVGESEVIGGDADSLLCKGGGDLVDLRRALDEATAAAPAALRGWLRRADGSRLHATGSVSRVHDDAGTISGFVLILRENTETCRMNETLRRRTRQLGEANVLLVAQAADLRRRATELDRLRAAAAEEGNRTKGLSFDLGRETAPPTAVTTDPMRLRQVLTNLVGNAIKFTDRGGVVVRLAHDPDRPLLRIAIADTGIGLDHGQLARLFDAFAQGDPTTSRRRGGSGLGLCISRHLARQLGGDIEVASTPGIGSVFTITIGTGGAQEIDAGCTGYACKPIDRVTLVEACAEAVVKTELRAAS